MASVSPPTLKFFNVGLMALISSCFLFNCNKNVNIIIQMFPKKPLCSVKILQRYYL